jgi:hypothetical protein
MSSLNVRRVSSRRLLAILFWIGLSSLITFLLLYRLNDWPKPFWEEGWTLDAARNWIEHGHLGNYLDGQPIPPYSPVRFPIVVSVALSMKILGAGVWQGRFANVIFTLLALGLIVYLTSKLFNRRVGFATLIILIFITPLDISPIYLGRTVLAEMPMMFYLLAGYAFVWLALQRTPAWGFAAMLVFGIALHAKLQVPPFWIASMVLAILLAFSRRQRRSGLVLIIITLGSIIVAGIVLLIQNQVMPGALNDPALIKILFNSVVFVVTWPIRKAAIYGGFLFSLPQILGLIWAGNRTFHSFRVNSVPAQEPSSLEETNAEIIRTALWGLGASWMIWYLSMALMWTRYIAPPYYIGCIFVAAYLDRSTNGFNLRILVRQISEFLLRRKFKWENIQAVIILIAFSIIFGQTIKSVMYKFSPQTPNPDLAAEYILNNIPRQSRVESFESELYFLSPDINYHFPSDLVSMELVRKWCIDPQLNISYDPMPEKPEYLIIGPYAAFWHPYDEIVASGWFQLEKEVGGYQIFRIKAANTK